MLIFQELGMVPDLDGEEILKKREGQSAAEA